ncbi:UDP-3-O-acyl-N-acetylglucosamine deacetylase [Terrihabitans rhizophilus]|uniref:UDP-3-O-acyl-N-acetylglucosamine deacetylase n=1 Tax=Terrihabitans rhizophilus TaxID=3092662 RepID=A0ABU4RLA3_9HYPH|nr:UDP-3-O-acyl-N-acetylglucosamine deacetylase [Terrihabitans sp. PJ23]MDX6805587.1 UDP-3-O-acyl-N-acetylglucosamine deacetylase [Terrihabitans sp. PJ23]
MGTQQTTLGGTIAVSGIGVHSGAPASIVLAPAQAGTGFRFLRTNLPGGKTRTLRGHVDQVGQTELCTVLGDNEKGAVSTVEHLLAALRGLGVDNAQISIDGPEMPIMDGSSAAFVEAVDEVGVVTLSAARSVLKVLKPIRVEQGRAWGELLPHHKGFRLEVEIDFTEALIGRQSIALDLTPANFRRQLSCARTFGFLRDFEKLSALGLARGSALENTVVIGDDGVLNPGGLRGADEFVRHKALDAVGDLALAGLPIQGLYRSYCGGHKLNVTMLRALYADTSAWTIETVRKPVRQGYGELVPSMQPVFSAEKA